MQSSPGSPWVQAGVVSWGIGNNYTNSSLAFFINNLNTILYIVNNEQVAVRFLTQAFIPV